jgi:hypothetical protein
MSKLALFIAAILLSSCVVWAQDSSGTVNSMSDNPYQNQEMTNTMGSTTGQPTDLGGERDMPNGLVPSTTTMIGSGSNGNLDQSKPEVPSKAEQGRPAAGAKTNTAGRNNSARGTSPRNKTGNGAKAPAGQQ